VRKKSDKSRFRVKDRGLIRVSRVRLGLRFRVNVRVGVRLVLVSRVIILFYHPVSFMLTW